MSPTREASPEAEAIGDAFAKAMSTPAKPRVDATTPPEIDHEAPHGRDEAGEPIAPYGYTRYGRPAKSPAGRKREGRETGGSDRARVRKPAEAKADDERTAGSKPTGDAPKPSGKNYMADLSGFGDAVWFGMSALGSIGSSIPVVGKFLPEDKIAAQAYVLAETKPRLVAAVNMAAQHNVKAEQFCQKLQGGDGFWALQCMFMVMPVISLSAAVWKGDKALAEMSDPEEEITLKSLAAKNRDRMDLFMAQIAAQMEAAQQEAMAAQGEVIQDAAEA